MSNLTVVPGGTNETAVEMAFIQGDLSQLKPAERLNYYLRVCNSLGLNPATQPFAYTNLNGALKLYARKDAAEQLRSLRGVSLSTPKIEFNDDLVIVSVQATDKTGRTDGDIGIVTIGGMKGDLRANAIMKAVTKAKRRATLSICGLGMLDETELETVAEAQTVPVDMETGEIMDVPTLPAAAVEAAKPYADEEARKTARKVLLEKSQDEFSKLAEAYNFTGHTKKHYGLLAVNLLGRTPEKWTEHEWIEANAKPDPEWQKAVALVNTQIAVNTNAIPETPKESELMSVPPAHTADSAATVAAMSQ